MSFDHRASRPMWEAVERFHALTYVAPEVRDEGTAAGLKGFWMNYFATRVAPVGAVVPAVVQATFFYYAPLRVNRAIPDAWRFASPEAIIAARYRGMDRALRRVYPDRVASADVEEAVGLIREAAAGCDPIGRILHAGWASIDWPTEPHLALWHGCTLLREYRSGNHLMAVCAEGLDGCESVVSHVAVGGAPRAWIRDEAGWSEAEEHAAVARLRERGWLDADGAATDACRAGRARIETMTDRLDFGVWKSVGEAKGRRLFDLLSDLATSLPPDDQLDWQHHYDS
jgi:hypothetical protein